MEGVEVLSSQCPGFSAVSHQIFAKPFLSCPGIFQLSCMRSLVVSLNCDILLKWRGH